MSVKWSVAWKSEIKPANSGYFTRHASRTLLDPVLAGIYDWPQFQGKIIAPLASAA